MNNKENYLNGSKWRKWDLHVHTPASGFGNETDYPQLISNLQQCEADVIGINDYSTISGYKTILNQGGVKNKVLFPVVEFRMVNKINHKNSTSEKGGVSINFHVIFSNQLSVKEIETEINSITCFYEGGTTSKLGHVEDVDLKTISLDFFETIKSFEASDVIKDKYLIWLPYDEYGGIDPIDPKVDAFFKMGILKKAHILGSGNQNQIDFFKSDRCLGSVGKTLPCIKGSDSHKIDYPFGKLMDHNSKPTNRYCWIKADPTFEGLKQIIYEPDLRVYIGEISPEQTNPKLKITNIKLSESASFPLSNQNIPINGDLTCIIGGRGAGKSGLLETLAYCYGEHRDDNSSFINYYLNKESSIKIEVDYVNLMGNKVDNVVITLNKDNKSQYSQPILYLGQNKIEAIADDKKKIHDLAFDSVTKNSDLSSDLFEFQEEIKSIELELAAANNEIGADRIQLNLIKADELNKEKSKLQNELDLLESPETKEVLTKLAKSRKAKDALEKIDKSAETIKKSIENLKEKLVSELEIINEKLPDVYLNNKITLNYAGITIDLDKQIESITREQIKAEYAEIMDFAKRQLEGKTDVTVDYIESIKTRIDEIDKSLAQHEKHKEFLKNDIKSRYSLIQELLDLNKDGEEIYAEAIEQFQGKNKDILKEVRLSAKCEFRLSTFINVLYEKIDKRKIKTKAQFEKEYFSNSSRLTFNLLDWIKSFEKNKENYDLFYGDGLKTFESIVYKNRYVLNTDIHYQIEENHSKPINQLSLGQKGTVILKLFLSTGNNCPIIIDQPEDHLDNNFIYKDLVSTLRNAKLKRQVIIVTHDANLVVNGDAEQIIIAQYENGSISYPVMGSLENPLIRKNVAEILEGGEIAFKKREQKYNIKVG